MSAPTYTSVQVRYRFWPEVGRPYRVVLLGEAVWARDRRGRPTHVESQPEKHVAACATSEAANASGERAAAKHGLPFKPWTVN